MAAKSEPGWAEVGFLTASAATMGGSVLVLWLGTAPWTDYLFIVLFCLAGILVFLAGAAWINRQFTDPDEAAEK